MTPTLAKNARMGHPMFRYGKRYQRLGHPPNSAFSVVMARENGPCARANELRVRRDASKKMCFIFISPIRVCNS